jgi:pimeloyl-ACP methyl ester carboxylesterase
MEQRARFYGLIDSMFKKMLPLLISVSMLLASCQLFQSPAPAPQPGPGGYTPKFETASCPFDAQNLKVNCGYLVVPEDRANPTGKTIRVAVGIFKATLPNPASDPIVYLEGGPGASPLRGDVKNFSIYFGPFNQNRDVILVDQRGTGYSQPALDCPEITQLALNQLNQHLTPDQSEQQSNQALQTCHDNLKAKGINLGAYTSTENAADLNDLRIALNIKQWNLYGISYGTRLALEAMRAAREGIRSVVIDSVFPPTASLVAEAPANFDRSMSLVYSACAADSACNAAYPDLKQVLFDTVAKLNANPASIKITQPDLGGVGKTGQQLDAKLDGNGLLAFFFQTLYISDVLPSIPALIYMAKDGNFTAIAQLQGQLLGEYKNISEGMHYSVECYEELPFDNLDKAKAAYQTEKPYSDALGTAQGDFDACKIWNVPAAPAAQDQAVSSDIPTMVVAGQYDPVTPPDWSKGAASTLSKSFFFQVPGAGHGPSLTIACPQKMVIAFFNNPSAAPDSSCLGQMKFTFRVPVSSMTVKLGPFNGGAMGFTGLVPADWKQAANTPGFYTPDGSELNSTQLLVQAAPISTDQFLNSMKTQLENSGVTIQPSAEKYNIQSAGGLKWTFYTADSGLIQIDIALAYNGKTTYLVILQSPWNELQALRQAVLVPVVNSIIGQ